MRVANLDMKDTNQQCPSGFRLVTSPRRSCGRPGPAGCVSTTFLVHSVKYSRVCRKITGYQQNTPNAFDIKRRGILTIDETYVDGVSLTHGSSPRKHIWTFATALDEEHSDNWVCPSVPVPALTLHTQEQFHCLLDKTISVRQVVEIHISTYFTQKTNSGMDRDVVQEAFVAVLTTLHGSVRNSHNQPEMILNSGCVRIKQLVMRTLHLR